MEAVDLRWFRIALCVTDLAIYIFLLAAAVFSRGVVLEGNFAPYNSLSRYQTMLMHQADEVIV